MHEPHSPEPAPAATVPIVASAVAAPIVAPQMAAPIIAPTAMAPSVAPTASVAPHAMVPVVTRVHAHVESPHATPSAATAGAHRFGLRALQSGRVSIVGTLVLSVLISTGLFSLQMISKWRRPKAVAADAHAESLDQPLTLAAPQDETPAPSEPDVAPSAPPSHAHASHLASDSEDAQRGLDDFFAANKTPTHPPAVQAVSGHAPYSPDPVDVSGGSGNMVDNRTAMAPESAPAQPSVQPASPPVDPISLDQKTAANVNAEPAPQQGVADQPSPLAPTRPEGAQPSTLYGLSEHSAASRQPVMQPSGQLPGQPALQTADNLHTGQATPSTAAAPVAAPQQASAVDMRHSSLDAPGPVILPGRPAPLGTSAAPGAIPTVASAGATAGVVPAGATVDSAPTPGDGTQHTAANAAQAPPALAPQTAGSDPVYGLFDHRTGSGTAAPDPAHSEGGNALAALDRVKVMSFQFRNAPWTVVLAQFAAETHLELRMQTVPQGVFNRWDSKRYSPSQTLEILNSDLIRTGCQLRLEGHVLRVCPTTPAAASASSVSPARASSAWLPQSSGIVPVSGRY